MSKTVLHKRSVAVVNGKPKLPTSAQTEYGEIAINYAKGYETLSIRNNQNEIVTFSSYDQIKKMLDDSELVIAASLNDLNSRINEMSANTIVYSGGTNIDVTDGVISVTGITVPITSITLNGSSVTVSGGVADLGNLMDEDDNRVIAEAIVDLNNQISGLSDDIATISGNVITKDKIISTEEDFTGVTTSGNVVDALVLKTVIEDNELNTAAAINDLYDKVDENEYLTAQAITQLESRIKELETALAGVEQILASI